MAKQIGDGFHLKFTIGKALWNDMFRVGLPFKVADGQFDLVENVRAGIKKLEVKQKVKGLLEDREVPQVLVRGKDFAKTVWGQRREQVYRVVNEVLRV